MIWPQALKSCKAGNLGPRFGEQPNGGVERLDLFGMADDIPCVEMADDADPQASDTLTQHCAIIGHRLVCACGIAWIMTGDDLEHKRVVAHRTVIGPIWSREKASGTTPRRLTLP
jgi:hypothetical protein